MYALYIPLVHSMSTKYMYSRLQKYCNKFPTSSSTGFQHSFDNTIGSPLYSGAGTGEFVAILLQSTVHQYNISKPACHDFTLALQ